MLVRGTGVTEESRERLDASSGQDVAYGAWSLWHKFQSLSFREKRCHALSLLRWLWRRHYFGTRHPVLLGRGVHIEKRHGLITTGGPCVIGSDCRLAVVGDPHAPATLHIGAGTTIGDRTTINARKLVEIGDRCSISWDCDICDSDFHQIVLKDGTRPEVTKPVRIEDDVWIGHGVLITKGVRIGRNSVVAAGAVVRRDMPPNSLVAGNPARPVGQITKWGR